MYRISLIFLKLVIFKLKIKPNNRKRNKKI